MKTSTDEFCAGTLIRRDIGVYRLYFTDLSGVGSTERVVQGVWRASELQTFFVADLETHKKHQKMVRFTIIMTNNNSNT